MSDNIPLEIQMEIIQRIPDIKWVIRCRSVSKAWKSVIDSKDFVTAHTLRHQAHNRHHLLVKKRDRSDKKVKYVSIVDDETFPFSGFSVFIPDSVNNSYHDYNSINRFSDHLKIISTSHGLFCLYDRETSIAVIWNPTIRKTVAIGVPNTSEEQYYRIVISFGICPRGLDPKLVKIAYDYDSEDVNTTSTHVEVFTLSSGGTWRSPLSGNVPLQSIRIRNSHAVMDGVIYWEAIDRNNFFDDTFTYLKLILSFDLTSEEFTKVNLPDHLALDPGNGLVVSNLKESVAVLQFQLIAWRRTCDIWLMIGHGCTRSFNKLYSIDPPDASIRLKLGFRKSGAPIIEVVEDEEEYDFRTDSLAIYEPESKDITYIGLDGLKGTYFVHSYKETLLLLDH